MKKNMDTVKEHILITTEFNVGDTVYHIITGKVYIVNGIFINNKAGTGIMYYVSDGINEDKAFNGYEIAKLNNEEVVEDADV